MLPADSLGLQTFFLVKLCLKEVFAPEVHYSWRVLRGFGVVHKGVSVTGAEQKSPVVTPGRGRLALTLQTFVSHGNSFSDSSFSRCAENSAWIVTWNSLMHFKIIPCYPNQWCFTCPGSLCTPKCKCKAVWQDKKCRWFRRCSGNNEGSETHPGSPSGVTPLLCGRPCSAASSANQTLKCRFWSLKWLRYFTLFLPLLSPNKLSVVHSCMLRGLVTKAWTLAAPFSSHGNDPKE